MAVGSDLPDNRLCGNFVEHTITDITSAVKTFRIYGLLIPRS
jgi:hypothetical protein